MTLQVEIRRLPAQAYVGARGVVPIDRIGPAMAEMIPSGWKHAEKRGLEPLTAPIAVFHSWREAKGTTEFTAGVFVDRAVPPEPPFWAAEIPACEAAVAQHVGPYSELGLTHGALRSWVERAGREVEECWEIYWTDPAEEPDPSRWRTEIFYRLSPARS